MHLRTSARLALAFTGLSAFGLVACTLGTDDGGAPEDSRTGALDQALYGGGTLGKLWDKGVVPVCFDDLNDHTTLQHLVPTILARSWSVAAHITFTGFGACAASGNQVKIVFSKTPGFNGVTDGYGVGAPRVVTLISDDTRVNRTHFQYEVIHEMGHALGFAHEQERPDNWSGGSAKQCAPPANADAAVLAQYLPIDGGVAYTATYDSNSIMNYCDPNGNNTIALSAGDIAGAQVAYGRSTLVSPVAPTGCKASIVSCEGHIGFACDAAVDPRPGDYLVLKRDVGQGDYEIISQDPYDFVDYSDHHGEIASYEVCTDNGLLETCTSPIAVKTPITQSCAGGAAGDPNDVNGLNPTCGKPPLRACPSLSQKTWP